MRFICSRSVQVTETLVMLIFPGIGSGRACRVENVSLGSHGGSHKSQLWSTVVFVDIISLWLRNVVTL